MSKIQPSLYRHLNFRKHNIRFTIITMLFVLGFNSFILVVQTHSAEQLLNEWLVEDLTFKKADERLLDHPNSERLFSGYVLPILDVNSVESINQIINTNDLNELILNKHPPNEQSSLNLIGYRNRLNRPYQFGIPVQNFPSNLNEINIATKDPKTIFISSFERNVSTYQSNLASSDGFETLTSKILFAPEYLREITLGNIYSPYIVAQQIDSSWSLNKDLNHHMGKVHFTVERLSQLVHNGHLDSNFISLALDFLYDEAVFMDHAQFSLNSIIPNDSFKLVFTDYYEQIDVQPFVQPYFLFSPAVMQLTDNPMSPESFVEAESILMTTKALKLTLNSTLMTTYDNDILSQNNENILSSKAAWDPNLANNLGAEYFIPIELGEFTIQVDYSYINSVPDSPNSQHFDASGSFDALSSRVTFTSKNNIWHVSAWMKNVTDENNFKQRNHGLFDVQQVDYADPQTYGIHFKYKFD